jgi:phosphonate transport system substrate-binding protein
LTAALLASLDERPASFFRSFFFTYGHPNVIRAVARGLADGGSMGGYVFDVIALTRPEEVAGVRILRRSEKLGFPPIACRRVASDTAVVHELRQALLGMQGDPRGQEILAVLHLDGFVTAGASCSPESP